MVLSFAEGENLKILFLFHSLRYAMFCALALVTLCVLYRTALVRVLLPPCSVWLSHLAALVTSCSLSLSPQYFHFTWDCLYVEWHVKQYSKSTRFCVFRLSN